MATLLSADQIIRQPLPDYRTGAHTTQSSAIHETRFVGNLTYWAEFEGSVETWYQGKRQTFSPQGIFPVFNSNVPNLLTTDYIRVGDETGIQGRFEERVGQVLSLVSSSENLGFKFADSRCALNRGEGIPDFAIIDNGDNAVVTGELKVPWVYAHSLATAVDDFHDGDQKALRGLLGMLFHSQLEENMRIFLILGQVKLLFTWGSREYGTVF